jgi:NTP pyrophosphatase (non-canonical NTP hydrolase)
MNPTEYQNLAKRTAGQFENENDAYVNWALGLAGEAGEVLELLEHGHFKSNDHDKGLTSLVPTDKLIKEVGDVLWYTALFCEQTGFDLGDILQPMMVVVIGRDPAVALTIASCNLADYIKKVACHGHDLDKEKAKKLVAEVYGYTHMLCDKHDLVVSEVMEANIAKLKARYPDGFSTEASINRIA